MKRILIIALFLLLLIGCSKEAIEPEIIDTPSKVTCPRGVSNDPHPGQCGQYIDNNNDGYCDLGQ
jgi:hypothetical protein